MELYLALPVLFIETFPFILTLLFVVVTFYGYRYFTTKDDTKAFYKRRLLLSLFACLALLFIWCGIAFIGFKMGFGTDDGSVFVPEISELKI